LGRTLHWVWNNYIAMTSTSDWPTNNQQTSSATWHTAVSVQEHSKLQTKALLCCKMNTSDSHPLQDLYGPLQKTWAEWTDSSTFWHHSLCLLAASSQRNIHYWWWRQCLVDYCSSRMLPVYHMQHITSSLHPFTHWHSLIYLLDASVHSNRHKNAAWCFITHRYCFSKHSRNLLW